MNVQVTHVDFAEAARPRGTWIADVVDRAPAFADCVGFWAWVAESPEDTLCGPYPSEEDAREALEVSIWG